LNVLSLFDGMSCGQIALNRAGIEYDKYFASEIDKHAIKVTQQNYPNTIQLGDVNKIDLTSLPKIDLLLGGSPCQDFSVAKTMDTSVKESLGLRGEKSSLFYKYLEILTYLKKINPNLKFLLENVKMNKESKNQLDNYLGVEGVFINSSLVSFQNRPRYYWTNIKFPTLEDKNISFQDYKETGHLSKYKLKKTSSRIKMWSDGKGRNSANYGCANVTFADKIQCLTAKQDRCPNAGLVEYEDFCRYLTRKELELAQTVPVGYTACLTYNQMQKVLGNGWTVDVIVHILKHMEL
jgi:hypothetical protein